MTDINGGNTGDSHNLSICITCIDCNYTILQACGTLRACESSDCNNESPPQIICMTNPDTLR